jgi:hypothetical protein
LRAFQDRVLRRIFGPGRTDVPGGWRRLLNGELHNLYKVMKSKFGWAGHAARMGEMRNAYKTFVGKPGER